MTGFTVLELLSKQGEEERRFEIVPADQAEAEGDRFYADGYYVTEHPVVATRSEAAAVIAQSL